MLMALSRCWASCSNGSLCLAACDRDDGIPYCKRHFDLGDEIVRVEVHETQPEIFGGFYLFLGYSAVSMPVLSPNKSPFICRSPLSGTGVASMTTASTFGFAVILLPSCSCVCNRAHSRGKRRHSERIQVRVLGRFTASQ